MSFLSTSIGGRPSKPESGNGLRRRYDGEADLSLYEEADEAEVLDRFQRIQDTTDSRRKFGVERNGLALLGCR